VSAEARLKELVPATLDSLHALARTLLLHEAHDPAVERLMGQLETRLRECLGLIEGDLRLDLEIDEPLVNGQPIALGSHQEKRCRALSALMEVAGIDELIIASGFERDDLEAFALTLAASLRSGVPTRGHIECGGVIARRGGGGGGLTELTPAQAAVWRFESVAAVSADLQLRSSAGRPLPTRPARRALRSLTEGLREASGALQMLAAMDAPRGPGRAARERAAVAVEVLGFGLYLGLDHAALMTLGLAALLGDLAGGGEPRAAIAPLVAVDLPPKLRVGVLMTVFDARSARAGDQGGVAGRMLATAEVYRALVEPPAGCGVSPLRALRLMKTGRAPYTDVAVAGAFAAFKGPLPVSSRLLLGESEHVRVVGRRARGEVTQILVAPIVGGGLGPAYPLDPRTPRRVLSARGALLAG